MKADSSIVQRFYASTSNGSLQSQASRPWKLADSLEPVAPFFFFFVADCQTETFFFLSDHRQTRMLETCRCRWQILFLPSARRDFQEGIGFIGCRFNAVHDGKLIGTHWISGLYRWTPILYTALLKYRREENYCYSRAVSTPLPFALHPHPPRFISSRSSRSFFLSR